ncbi:hypothetical protein Q5530_06145 [Saccharothrix sp. BKS2]|uniref:hypothetical protein n=1 Tax=Saccharothrix sp. BKS2 TaxID=3064400 RepID=UPI0039E7C3E6
MRLLLLIAAAGQPPTSSDGNLPDSAVSVVRTQVKLQKLDFWVRYPDYLANELLTEFEKSPDEPHLLTLAAGILDSDEPDLRRLPMLRHRFGAFEPLDDALAPLVEKGLIRKTQVVNGDRVSEHRYWLTRRGREVVDGILDEAPVLSWYVERTRLVVALAEGSGGTQLKDRQYLVRDYAETPTGTYLPSIAEQARDRLAGLKARHAHADAALAVAPVEQEA